MGQVASSANVHPDAMATTGDTRGDDYTDSGNEPASRETLNCVKNRIDLLIEGCLSKSSDNSWSSASDASPREATPCPEEKNCAVDKTKDEDKGVTVDGDVSQSDAVDSRGVDKKCPISEETKHNSNGGIKPDNVHDVPESNFEKSDSDVDSAMKVKTKMALSDLVKEITSSDNSLVCQKKNMTTFQTFIDQVLDNTLLHVKDEKPTHILQLCNESLTMENATERSIQSNEQAIGDKNREDRRDIAQGKSVSQSISLKDHIERFLELSFKDCQDSPEKGSKEDGNNSSSKDLPRLSVSTENFNAQGLVNNMISQGLQINKLLSPPISRSQEAQQSSRTKTDLEPGEIMTPEKTAWKADKQHIAQEMPMPPVSKPHEHESRLAALMRAQPVRMDSYRQDDFKPYHRNPHGQPNISVTSPVYNTLQKGEHRDLRDPRFVDPRIGSPQVDMSHIDPRLEIPDRRQEYNSTVAQKQIPLSPIPHRADMRMVNPSQSEPMLHPSLYHQQFPPRSVHSVHQGHKGIQDQGLDINEHLQGGRMRPVHPRDCMCPMCVLPENRHDLRPDIRRESESRQDVHPYSRYDSWQDNKSMMRLNSPAAMHIMNSHKSPEIHIPKPQRSPTIRPYHFSPNVPLNGQLTLQDQSPAMMRPSHSVVPPEFFGYPNSPKLLPHHPPITSPKEFHNAQMSANAQAIKSPKVGQRSDNQTKYQSNLYSNQSTIVDERQRDAYIRTKGEPLTPQRVGRQDGRHDLYYARRASSPIRSYHPVQREPHPVQREPQPVPVSRTPSRDHDVYDNSSNKPEMTTEAPLDLTCKRSEQEYLRRPSSPVRHRSLSFSGTPANTNMKVTTNPLNMFIKHLENSVDKYCQQDMKLSPPRSSPPQFVPQRPHSGMSNRAITPDEFKSANVQGYQPRSPHVPSPQRQMTSPFQMQNRPHATSPHFFGQSPGASEVGGIPRQMELPPGSVAQQPVPPPVVSNQNIATSLQGNFDPNRSKTNNVSKHEPIQNIIGNHDPNDILYLICRLCAQTYGSPYGFRKHFRNQHGFEPRSEHTIVQTISATKSALHGPQVPLQVAPSQTLSLPTIEIEQPPSGIVRSERRPSSNSSNASSVSKVDCIAPSDTTGSTDVDHDASPQKPQTTSTDGSETKLLVCPECQKTFQLNDFGSYKRHCRQHSQGKAIGPYTCSECHLSFPEPQLLKDHCNGSHNTIFSCVPCEKTFGDMSAYMLHIHHDHDNNEHASTTLSPNDQPPKLSPQIDLSKSNNSNSPVTLPSVPTKSESSVSDHIWPDISLSVIPSHSIVKQAAESMTTTQCPDSSWDDTAKVVTGSCEDKVDDCVTSDSGYSSSIGSNSALVMEVEKNNEKNVKCLRVDIVKQKSEEQTSPVEFNQVSEFTANMYKHKKFALHRKRECSSNSESNVDITPCKQPKSSPVSVSSYTTLITSTATEINNDRVDSSDNSEAISDFKCDVQECEAKDSKTIIDTPSKEIPGGINIKQGARHNLPFVWDRVTRSQIGRKTK